MDSGTPGAATTDAATLKTATQRASVKAKSLRSKVGSAACQIRSSLVSATRVQRMRSLGLKDGGRHWLVTRSTTSPARCLALRRASSSSLRGAASTRHSLKRKGCGCVVGLATICGGGAAKRYTWCNGDRDRAFHRKLKPCPPPLSVE